MLFLLQKKLVINHSGRLDCAELACLAWPAKRTKFAWILRKTIWTRKSPWRPLGKPNFEHDAWWEKKTTNCAPETISDYTEIPQLRYKLTPQPIVADNFSRTDRTTSVRIFHDFSSDELFVITSKQLVHTVRLFNTQNTTENTHIKFFLPVSKAENFLSLGERRKLGALPHEGIHWELFTPPSWSDEFRPKDFFIVFTFNEKVASNNAACNFLLPFFIWSGVIPSPPGKTSSSKSAIECGS